jgi:DNA-directed RNA polymerase subunit RPC12/RpoP
MNLNIKIDELEDYKCTECGGIQFAPIFGIKVIGAIQSPTGKAGSLHHQMGFMCSGCGAAKTLTDISNECKKISEASTSPIEIPFRVVGNQEEKDEA